MAVQIRDILENFPDLLVLNRGLNSRSVADIQTGATASDHSLVFISNRDQFAEAEKAEANPVWIVDAATLAKVPERIETVLVSPNPTLAMALAAKRFFAQKQGHQIVTGPKIHASATISERARIGQNCIVGPGAVIGDECEIGDDCIIGANSVIEAGVKIGSGTYIHPLVFIGHSCIIGNRCEIHPNTTIGSEGYGYAHDKSFNHYRITHYGRVILEDDVHIGAGVQIDRGTFADSRVGAGTKIDNHCHFGHNITIGRNTLITGGMITAGSTTIGSNCVFGGRVTSKGHLKVGDGVQVAGLSAISKDVLEPGEYAGVHLHSLRDEMRMRAAMRELPGLLKQIKRIIKHLGFKKETRAE